VEVELPSVEDAAAVRRFARERRERARRPDNRRSPDGIDGGEPLESLIDRICDRGRVALTVFAAGLAAASSAELIARAERIAHNFRDVADMQRRSSGPTIESEGA
jgi:hypothetical protein